MSELKNTLYTAEEINSNIAYGNTTVNNITEEELKSIQYLCEKVAYLEKQLAEKDKEIERLNKCMSEQADTILDYDAHKILENLKAIECLNKVKETCNKTIDNGDKFISLKALRVIIAEQIKELEGEDE